MVDNWTIMLLRITPKSKTLCPKLFFFFHIMLHVVTKFKSV